MSWERYLDLTVNIATKTGTCLVVSKSDPTPVDRLEFYARDRFPVRVRFVEPSGTAASPLTVVQFPATGALVLKGNKKTDPGADPSLYSAEGFTEVEVTPGSDWYYEAELNLNTTPGNAAVDALAGNETLDCSFDFENQNAGNTQRRTLRFSANIIKDVARNQGVPAGGNPQYPAADSILVNGYGAAVDLTNGSDTLAEDISSLSLGSAPRAIQVSVAKPSAGDANLFATVLQDTITANGFSVGLSADVPAAGYKLHYLIIP